MSKAFRYIIIPENEIKPYLNDGQAGDDLNFMCRSIYSLLGLETVEVSHAYLETIRPQLGRSFEEVPKQEALDGKTWFGVVDDKVKVWKDSVGNTIEITMHMEESGLMEKFITKVPFTDEMKARVASFMSRYAKEIIENEYSKKLRFIKNVSELEASTWEIQKHEAREFLQYGEGDPDHVTPFLDYIAKERGFTKTDLANKILQKAEEYQDKLSTILVQSQKLLKKFEEANTIWDLNILYEDYFGLMMPTEQAITLKRAHDGKNEDGTIDPWKHGLRMTWFDSEGKANVHANTGTWAPDVINPYIGNKLNF